MIRFHHVIAVAGLLAAGCASPKAEGESSESDLGSFDPDRNRSCSGGCAEGTVCDDSVHACVAEPRAPEIVFPISGAITTGLPEVAWTTDASATESAVEICKDAQCTQSVATLSGAGSAALATALPRGTYFVRAWGVRKAPDGHVVAGATAAKARVFRSNGRAAPSKTALAWFAVEAATKDEGSVTAGGVPRSGAILVPDMDGDGRTEVAEIRDAGASAKLVLSRLDDTGQVAVTELDVSAQAELLLLGDVDRDGRFDLGAARKLADGVRLEIFFGGAGIVARRQTVDVRMPMENGKTTELASVSAVGDLDGDGWPDLALGGHADTTTEAWGATIPRSGVFIDGWADGDRFYVFRGAAVQPFAQALDPMKSEGTGAAGLVPLGDVDGDGIMDAIGLDTKPARLVAYEADEHMSSHWNEAPRGLRPGRGYVVFGGSPLRKAQIVPPTYWREGPAASWAYGPAIVGEYDEVQGIRTIASGRAREEYFFDVSVTGAGDWDGDGFFDVAFGMSGARAPAPLSGETWDTFSDANEVRDYAIPYEGGTSTWHRFAAFVEARYGSPSGLPDAPAQRILSPTIEASQAMVQWVIFPAAVEAHDDGLFVAEAAGALNMNPPSFTPFEGTFAGPPGSIVRVP